MNFLGLSNQNMSTRPDVASSRSFFTAFSGSDTSWTCTATGYYTFTARGGGGMPGGSSGGGAAAAQRTVLLFRGQVVTFTVGRGGEPTGTLPSTDTVVTFPDGKIMTAGGGGSVQSGPAPGLGGTASGGDINVNGEPGIGVMGGTSPAIGNFPAVLSLARRNPAGPGTGGYSVGAPGSAVAGGDGVLYLQAGKV